MMHIKAAGKKVLVKRASADEFADKESKILKAGAQDAERPYHGHVLHVGPLVKSVKEGDYVLFSRYAGIDGPSPDISKDHYMLIEEEEVAGFLDVEAFRAELAAAKKVEEDARASLTAARAQLRDQENGASGVPAHLFLPQG